MKKLKLFEEFLLEKNEVVKAQGICKNSIFQAEKMISKFYNKIVDAGYIKGYKTKITPYNNGYELKLTYDIDYISTRDLPGNISDNIYKLANQGYLYLQPSSFFESSLDANDGGAYFEIRTFIISDTDQGFEKFAVATRKDIPKVQKYFLDELEVRIKHWESLLEL